jgi:ATP-dependent RNA circularization protein (DNA/RNA ligase family)
MRFPVNSAEIELLVDRLMGAYPSTKVADVKVKALWTRRGELLGFPTDRAADLIDYVLNACRFFPSFSEMVICIDMVLSPRRESSECENCGGTGFVVITDEHGDVVRFPHRNFPDGAAVYSRATNCEVCNN